MRSWWRGVSPLTKLSLLFIVGLVATALVGLPVKAQAAGSDSNWHGYFYGGGPVYYGDKIDQYHFSTNDTNKQSFINSVSTSRGKPFIVNVMLGRGAYNREPSVSGSTWNEFVSRVNNPDIGITHYAAQACRNSMRDFGGWEYYFVDGDCAFYDSLVFYSISTGRVYTIIKIECANPLNATPLPTYNPNQTPTGSMTPTCNPDGSAVVRYNYRDADAGTTNARILIWNDTTPAGANPTDSTSFTSPPWVYANSSTSYSQTVAASQTIGASAVYAILYVQDVGPAGTGKFYRVQRPLQIKCDHPPVGSVKGDCPAGIRAVGVYDWDSPATNLRVEVYSGALRGQSGSVREFSGTTVNRELTVPMSDLAGVRNGALGIDQRSVTFFVYFINVNDAGNETATQNTYKQLDIGPCNTCQSIPITSATNDNSPQPGEAFKSDFKVYYPDAASAAAAAAAPISLTVSGPSGNQTVPGINKATGTSGSGASIRYFVTGTANFAGMSPTGKNTVVFTAGGSYPVQIMPAGSPTPCPMNISAKPYVSVGIGDVTAGAPIMDKDGVCSAQATSGIAGWNSNQPGYSGAGGKFGVTALGIIVGFASGQSTASSGTGLSFANTANNNPSSGQFGGQFGSGGSCWQPPTENVVTEAASTLNGKTVATGTHQTIHFTGDLYITDNVIYAEGWGSLRDIPSLVIYVDGNIYIDANVTRLDGTYMARPTSATTGGQIYTCATSAAPIDTTSPSYFSTCGKQLVVNGSLIAQKVHLLRTCGTLQQAVGNEPVTTSGGTDLLTCGTGSHAAEVINNGPSDWMGRANMNSLAGDKWDSIVSLPPVL